MRGQKKYINEDGSNNLKSTFLSCEKDAETIIRKLFVESQPYSDDLKRLLVINTKDCLEDRNNEEYKKKIQTMSVSALMKGDYIRFRPLIALGENEEVKSYIRISFDNFNKHKNNTYYRNHTLEIDVVCNVNQWELNNYQSRPLKIAGYIDGILDQTKLSGIGLLDFIGCSEFLISENLAGYCLLYKIVSGDDDKIGGDGS